MEKSILITGANGFIGKNLLNKLFVSNTVNILLRKQNKFIHKNINEFIGDVCEIQTIIPAIEGCSTIFHCAAFISFDKKLFKKAYQINVLGTRNVLEAAYQTGIKKVVHLSACAVLGFSKDKNIIIDETANPYIDQNNVYAYTKKLAEEEVQKYVRRGLDISIANIATVYGPGDRKQNSGSIIKSIYESKMRFIPPGGTSFVSVDDLVDGLILLADKGKPGERYIFCTENMEYKLLIQRIANTLGVKEPKIVLPNITYYPVFCTVRFMEIISSLIKKDINLMNTQILKEAYGYKYFSSIKAKNELKWEPVYTFEETIKKAFNYYIENGLI